MNDEMKPNPKPQVKRIVQIRSLNRKGEGQGTTHTGGTLMVPYTIPGETVEAVKLRRQEGRLLNVYELSPHRVEPVCRHFQRCGGCSWQHIEYPHQLLFKREWVAQRMAEKCIPVGPEQIEIVSAEPFEYRGRMDLLWWYDGSFGLRQKGKWYSAVNLEECRLLPAPVMQTALDVNRRVQESGLPFRDSKRQTPGLRYLVIRSGIFTGDIQLSFVSDALSLPSSLWEGLKNVTSVYQLLNENLENDLSDGEAVHLWGEPFYRERICGREFFVGPRSFFQPNPVVASRMVEHVREIVASLPSKEGLIDLYCGIGLFAISLCDCFGRVIGIENNQEAVALAKRNAGDAPVLFACLDAEKWSWPSRRQYDTLLVDPPRTGLHASVIPLLKNEPFTNLIYVSCNPHRGIEDIAVLLDAYDLISVKLFDQFPQTVHVEMIAHLRKKA